MKKFTIIIPQDGEPDTEVIGQGNHIVGAFDNLCDNMRLSGFDATDDEERELLEYCLAARDNPNTVVERSDFSVPENNYSVVFEDDTINPVSVLEAMRARLTDVGEGDSNLIKLISHTTIDRFWDLKRLLGRFFGEHPGTYNR